MVRECMRYSTRRDLRGGGRHDTLDEHSTSTQEDIPTTGFLVCGEGVTRCVNTRGPALGGTSGMAAGLTGVLSTAGAAAASAGTAAAGMYVMRRWSCDFPAIFVGEPPGEPWLAVLAAKWKFSSVKQRSWREGGKLRMTIYHNPLVLFWM